MIVGTTNPQRPHRIRLPLGPPNHDNLTHSHGHSIPTTHTMIPSHLIPLHILQQPHPRRIPIIQLRRLLRRLLTLPPRVLSPMPSASFLILVYLDRPPRYLYLLLRWLLLPCRLRRLHRFWLRSRNGRSSNRLRGILMLNNTISTYSILNILNLSITPLRSALLMWTSRWTKPCHLSLLSHLRCHFRLRHREGGVGR